VAFAETTNPDIANQFGATDVAPAQLRAQIESAWKRIGKAARKPVYYEPQWEDPGLHGSSKQVSLRGARLASSPIGRGRMAMPVRSSSALPPMPVRGRSAGEVVLIAGVAAAVAGGLAYYLWKRRPAGAAVHVGELEPADADDNCGFHMLGAD